MCTTFCLAIYPTVFFWNDSLSRLRCSEGGFDLWLGDNSDIVDGKTSTSIHILTDSGASKHMIGYKGSLPNLIHKDSRHNVKLSDDYQYPIKGVAEASYKLYFGKAMRMKDVFYVSGLKKNLLSISALDEKGFRVAFVDREVLMCPKGKTFDDAVVIGVQEGGLYK
jgi:hypothetical protein